jgi:hypothetical protein
VGELKGELGLRGSTVELLDHLEDVVVDLLVCLARNVEEAIDPGLAYI